MEKSAPSKLSNLRELVAQLSLAVQIQAEISSILDDYHSQIYALEQDRTRLQATVRDHSAKIQSLEKRYSELLYKFSELKRK